jgi:hypothetical protein
MKKIFWSIIIIVFSMQSLYAVGDYLLLSELGSSAKMIRIANIEGFSPVANVVFENPSALHRTNKFTASAFMTTLMEEVEYKNVAIAMRLPVGILGLGYMTAGVTEIPHTFINPNRGYEFDVDGYFDYNNTLAKVSYCVSQSKELHFGVSASYFSTDLYTYSGKGYNFDAGVTIENETIAISIAMKNISSSLSVNYSDSENDAYSGMENLPLQTIYSLRYNLNEFTLYGQLKSFGSSRRLTRSMAINYTPEFIPIFSISGGYKEYVVLKEVRNNYTLGIGLNVFGASFDYAYEQSDHYVYNHKHYFSLGLAF